MSEVVETNADQLRDSHSLADAELMPELHPDLEPYLDEQEGRRWLNHPLYQGTVYLPELIDNANRVYLSKLDDLKVAQELGNWRTYVFLHERPGRIDALHKISNEISEDHAYWKLVGDVWTDTEFPWEAREAWHEIFNTDRTCQRAIMEPEELEALEGLPDPIPIYRGFLHDDGLRGFSWSTKRDRAELFAWRSFETQPGHPRIATATVPKRLVIAYLDGRNESEILVLPENVTVTAVEASVLDEAS